MKDATLAAIAVEIDHLRTALTDGTVEHAVVILCVGNPPKLYYAQRGPSEEEGKAYLSFVLEQALIKSGLVSQAQWDEA